MDNNTQEIIQTGYYKGLGLIIVIALLLATLCYGYFKGALMLRIDRERKGNHKFIVEYTITNYGLNRQFVLADDNYFSATAEGMALVIKIGDKLNPDLIQANKFFLPKIVSVEPLHSILGKLEIDESEVGIRENLEESCVKLSVLTFGTLPYQNINSIVQYNSFVELHGRWIETTNCASTAGESNEVNQTGQARNSFKN